MSMIFSGACKIVPTFEINKLLFSKLIFSILYFLLSCSNAVPLSSCENSNSLACSPGKLKFSLMESVSYTHLTLPTNA